MNRREVNRMLGLGGGLLGLSSLAFPQRAWAQADRVLDFQLLGYVLGIQVPATAGIFEILPSMPGYAEPTFARLNQIRVVTQTMVGGTADIGDSDPPTVISAVEAGAQLKIVGKLYDKTSLVLVVNADRVKSIEDLAKPETRVAISARGEIVHVMLVEPLLKRNLDFDSMTVIEMPGSGARVSALLSDRIDAGNVHFDQVAAIADQGNFKVLIEPWKEFAGWTNEIWVVRSEWLEDPDNERALVDMLKATLVAFRRANDDFDWYLEQYRKYATLQGAAEETAEHLRPIWERLQGEIGAWPADMNFSVAELESLVPAYKAAGAIRGTVPIADIVEPKYVQQALDELG